jgi:hypothetical protein
MEGSVADRLFRLLPWAPCAILGIAIVDFPLRASSASVTSVLLSPGIREVVVLWIVPTIIVLLHLAWTKALSGEEKRQWRRHLLVGGWGVALIYLCSADKRIPAVRAEDA